MTSRLRLASARRLGASLYYGGLHALGVCAATRRLADAGLILCYHNTVPANAAGAGCAGLHLSSEQFERQMRWLRGRYSIVSLREFVETMAAGTSMRSLAAVTFDDGYAGVFEHAVPILQAFRTPATIFLVAGAVGRSTGFWWDHPEIVAAVNPAVRQQWLTELHGDGDAILARGTSSRTMEVAPAFRPADWNLIRAGSGRGIDLGAHSATHRSLPTLDSDELEDEVVTSRAVIHQATGIRPEFFAYPYGRWDARVRDRVRAAGYRAALTLDAGPNRTTADPWALCRINIPSGLSDAAFDAWTTVGLRRRRTD